MSELLPADYAIFALALVLATTGLFKGLSGMVAFAAGTFACAFAATAGWSASGAYFDAAWKRLFAVLAVALLAFGAVRTLCARFIHVLVAQPGDAIFGFLAGALAGLAAFPVWAKVGLWLEYSSVAAAVASFI